MRSAVSAKSGCPVAIIRTCAALARHSEGDIEIALSASSPDSEEGAPSYSQKFIIETIFVGVTRLSGKFEGELKELTTYLRIKAI